MNNQEKYIARFLRQESTSKKISRYHLRFAARGKSGHPVETFDIVEALDLEDLDRLAETIHARAQMDANGMGPSAAPYRYTLTSVERAKEEGEEDFESGRVHFRVRAEADLALDGDSEAGEEAPTSTGLLTQLMRHNEANNRVLVGALQTILGGQAKREEMLNGTIERLLNERDDMFTAIEAARSQEHERKLLAESEHAKQQRINFGIQKLALLAPVALEYMTGGKIKAKDSPQSLIIKELISGFTPEQFAMLGRILRPEQMAAFARLWESMKETEAGKEKTDGDQVS